MSKLRILVPVKRVIDSAIKPRVSNNAIDTKGLKFAINPFCDIALEEAIRIKEKNPSNVENIHAVSAGPKVNQETLRTALAKGADDSTLIQVDETLEPLTIAKLLAKVVEKQSSNVVILGKQAVDDDNGQTGQLLAGILNWPQATNASKVDIKDDTVTVTREIDGGSETVKAKLPIVITTDLRLNEPRYATLPNIMKAKKKPMATVSAADLGVDVASRIKVLKVEEPPVRQAGVIVESVDELLSKLKEKGAL
jgi:electron transfer flavoprotein alpha/beta subunit